MKRAVIFDMDGLMIDSERVTFEGYQELCAKEGKILDEPTYLLCLGKPVAGIHQVFYDAFGDDFPTPDIMKENHARMAHLFATEGVPVKEGLIELLHYLKDNGYRTIVATSSNRDRVDTIFEEAGITDLIDDSVCGNEVEKGKPNPDIFLKALEKAGVNKEEAFILEDSESGIEAGSRAGIDVICIPDMKQPEEQYAAKCRSLEKSLLSVLDQLKSGEL